MKMLLLFNLKAKKISRLEIPKKEPLKEKTQQFAATG